MQLNLGKRFEYILHQRRYMSNKHIKILYSNSHQGNANFNTTTHSLEWLKLKGLILSVSENMEQLELHSSQFLKQKVTADLAKSTSRRTLKTWARTQYCEDWMEVKQQAKPVIHYHFNVFDYARKVNISLITGETILRKRCLLVLCCDLGI